MKLSDEHKKKISVSRQKLGDKLSGWHHSYEAKMKIGAASAGNKYAQGNKLSIETRSKISQASSDHVLNGYGFKCRATYDNINFADAKEALFAIWCDNNGIRWRYQPIIFKINDVTRYVPDFILLDSGEFVEVGDTGRNKRYKMDKFIEAGHILHHIQTSGDLEKLSR